MNFNLTFNISENQDCKSVTFCDTTCTVNHYNSFSCCDGYGVGDNIVREDISYTRFHWIMPNGDDFFSIDRNWVPGTKAKASFQVTGGTNGIIVVGVDNIIIGQTIFVTDIATTVSLLINNINTIASSTGWQAYLVDGTTDTIIIESINFGAEYNSKGVDISVSQDITVDLLSEPTSGANGNDNCVCFTMQDIYESNKCMEHEFQDGVHTVTYMLYDSDDNELARETNKVLFTCLLKCKIKKLLLLPAESKCVCSDKFNERLVELRLMLEKAEVEMEQCLYDCANDTITKAHKMADGLCLDC